MSSAAMQPFVEASFSKLADGGIEHLSKPQRVVVCVWGLIGEVDNGGFDQWLFNSSGDWASRTIEALETLSAYDVAALVYAAIAVFPGTGPSPNLSERRAQMQNLSVDAEEILSSLDKRFANLEDKLKTSLLEYVLFHEAELSS